MKLAKYLKDNGITVIEFANDIKKTRGAVYSYLSGAKIPSPDTQRKIYKVTGKQITPMDWVL